MNELTTEQKAQRYVEALKIAKEVNNEHRAQPFDVMTRVFPELKEPDDESESIKKWIKKELESKYVVDNIVNNEMADKALAWLEKQGEQNLANSAKLARMSRSLAWSEEDEYNMLTTISSIDYDIRKENEEKKEQISWLESLKDRVQPKQEWSEEDKHNLLDIEAMIHTMRGDGRNADKLINWLKERIQHQKQWKPSKEQMETLEYYMHALICNKRKEVLFGLYSDLKEL